jgi:hypothetical protein
MMPDIGNGYVASIVGFASMHVSGFFNGGCGDVTKAHLPSVVGISVTNAQSNATQALLSLANGTYTRRLHVGSAVVEQRIYAHRVRKNIMLTEFEIVSPPSGGGDDVTIELTTLYDPMCGPSPPPPPAPPEPMWNNTYVKVSSDSGPNGHDVASLPQVRVRPTPLLL